jgi:uncharacterized membrane protein YoaK (UPF0700 family)/anti-anti-sigma regulatory factor
VFVSQAHSFAQQSRLAITLAWIAGYTNILTVFFCATVTSHVSGTTSNLGSDLVLGRWSLALFAFFLLTTFAIGAFISGMLLGLGRIRHWSSIYMLPMALQAILLAAFALLVEFTEPTSLAQGTSRWILTGIASMAMGLQNATITRISGGVVRTTHVTGVLTDVGLEAAELAVWARQKATLRDPQALLREASRLPSLPSARRLTLLATIVFSFALGAALGTLAHEHIPRYAMFPPVIFLLWIIYQDWKQPIAQIAPLNLDASGSTFTLPPQIAVYHLRPDDRLKPASASSASRTHDHRLPNLLTWLDDLSPSVQCVVLDLTFMQRIEPNAALNLAAAFDRLRKQHRALILAGLSTRTFQDLVDSGASDLADPSIVCPDLELAIARAYLLISP